MSVTQTDLVVEQLRAIHTLKASALRMFDPMLAGVEAEQRRPDMEQVRDLPGSMPSAFGGHRDETARHAAACLSDDQEMAAKITSTWENVLSLSLASRRIRFERPVPAPA